MADGFYCALEVPLLPRGAGCSELARRRPHVACIDWDFGAKRELTSRRSHTRLRSAKGARYALRCTSRSPCAWTVPQPVPCRCCDASQSTTTCAPRPLRCRRWVSTRPACRRLPDKRPERQITRLSAVPLQRAARSSRRVLGAKRRRASHTRPPRRHVCAAAAAHCGCTSDSAEQSRRDGAEEV